MKSELDDVFTSSYPFLDLHGESRDSANFLVKEFIEDNYHLKNYKLSIIHGIGTGALKKEVFSVLKQNKFVDSYHLSHYNSGCTIVHLKHLK